MEISLNDKQRLFVIQSGNSVGCLGFDHVYASACELSRRLRDVGMNFFIPLSSEIGSLLQYEQYKDMLTKYQGIGDAKTWYDDGTPVAVQKILERVRKDSTRVRLFFGNNVSGRDWMEEFSIMGRVSRSSGPMHVPTLLSRRNSIGGPAILTDRIVRILDLDSRVEVYRHSKYHLPTFWVADATESAKLEGFSVAIKLVDETNQLQTHMNFKSVQNTEKWIGFIRGERHARPRY